MAITRPSKAAASRLFLGVALCLAVALAGAVTARPAAAVGIGWSAQTSGTTNWLYGAASADVDHAWAVGESGTILATTDGGLTWRAQPSGDTGWLFGVACADVNHAWVVGHDGTILATTDGGRIWNTQTSGTTSNLYSVTCADVSHAWAVGSGGIILATTDGGATWTQQSTGMTAGLRGVACANDSRVWAVGGQGSAYGTVLGTTDGGASWIDESPATGDFLTGVACSDATHAWVAGDAGAIFATTDGGAHWASQDSGTDQNLWAVSCVDVNHVWVSGASGTVVVTADGGGAWNVPGTSPTGDLWGIVSADMDHVWAVNATGGIFAYGYPAPAVQLSGTDTGWHKAAVDLTATATVDATLSLHAFQYSFDGGVTWTDMPGSGASRDLSIATQGVHAVTVRAIDSSGAAATATATVKIDTTGPVTAAKAASGKVGKKIALLYKVTDNLSPDATAVRVVVRNSKGKTVTTFSLGKRALGKWLQVVWKPKTSGTYHYSVFASDEAGNTQSTLGSAKVAVAK